MILIIKLKIDIKVLVDKEMEAIRQKSKLPITMLVQDDRKTKTIR